MEETNEKVKNLKNFIERRTELLSFLKQKEDVKNLSQNDDDSLSEEFEKALDECIECDSKIKEYKTELEPRFFIKFEESEYTNNSQETALVLKTENKRSQI